MVENTLNKIFRLRDRLKTQSHIILSIHSLKSIWTIIYVSSQFHCFFPKKVMEYFYKQSGYHIYDQFHLFSSLPHILSSYLMILIPKVKSLPHLGKFIPISSVESFDKLVAKVLATRLGLIMEKLISHNQVDFSLRESDGWQSGGF